MAVLIIRMVGLAILVAVLAMWAIHFPYPSPFTRRWMPPRKHWPETQIHGWLRTGRFHRSFLHYFYRDPERVVPSVDGWVVPADGLVTSTDVKDGVRYLVRVELLGHARATQPAR